VSNKPLGHKGYGSIPHLPGSRLGPGDHHCHVGQEAICWHKARDQHDRIIVTEKLDGSNVSVAKLNGETLAIGRSGYLAQTSRYEQHQIFAAWVRENEKRFADCLRDGERLVGEWMAQAHGTRYRLPHEPFVVFDLMAGQNRLPHDECRRLAASQGFAAAAILHDGGPVALDKIEPRLANSSHGALDPVEGAVWRVERRGEFDFIAKWVRPDKKDGFLLPELSGADPVWNWRPLQAVS
jgi:hypothetical protein